MNRCPRHVGLGALLLAAVLAVSLTLAADPGGVATWWSPSRPAMVRVEPRRTLAQCLAELARSSGLGLSGRELQRTQPALWSGPAAVSSPPAVLVLTLDPLPGPTAAAAPLRHLWRHVLNLPPPTLG